MRERPILFNGAMVRAILAGQKTQTRRIVKPQPDIAQAGDIAAGCGICARETADDMQRGRLGKVIQCPYGQPGDRLWVRETWNARPVSEVDSGMYEAWEPYKAIPKQQPSNAWVYFEADGDEEGPWRPSIHMPRWASRITLEITGVRVERLQDISEDDAVAEGILPHEHAIGPIGTCCDGIRCIHCGKLRRDHVGTANVCFGGSGTCWNGNTARGGYAWLWDSINGIGSWKSNPYVWVVEFKRTEP